MILSSGPRWEDFLIWAKLGVLIFSAAQYVLDLILYLEDVTPVPELDPVL